MLAVCKHRRRVEIIDLGKAVRDERFSRREQVYTELGMTHSLGPDRGDMGIMAQPRRVDHGNVAVGREEDDLSVGDGTSGACCWEAWQPGRTLLPAEFFAAFGITGVNPDLIQGSYCGQGPELCGCLCSRADEGDNRS